MITRQQQLALEIGKILLSGGTIADAAKALQLSPQRMETIIRAAAPNKRHGLYALFQRRKRQES
jgi:hypothetical protein